MSTTSSGTVSMRVAIFYAGANSLVRDFWVRKSLCYSADSHLPSLMPRTFYRARKFCQEMDEIKLPDAQIGKISLPLSAMVTRRSR
ncbi:hypothetical protein C8R43DRAFT_1141402 [Mycena crocata]|nr:hypothetical protein C8R43DRAFT_1141402 [Mycena crocata]